MNWIMLLQGTIMSLVLLGITSCSMTSYRVNKDKCPTIYRNDVCMNQYYYGKYKQQQQQRHEMMQDRMGIRR